MTEFLTNYFSNYKNSIITDDLFENISKSISLIKEASANGHTLFIQGNGASASIASHCALDFTKQAKIKSMSFNEASFITAFANDYGYEYWVEKALGFYAEEGDIVILISSSGNSPNIVNAAKYAQDNRIKVITFSGFSSNNKLIQKGDINFWLNSRAYNVIECIHMIWLTAIIDGIIGKAEYSVK